jgi:hypothetical protein
MKWVCGKDKEGQPKHNKNAPLHALSSSWPIFPDARLSTLFGLSIARSALRITFPVCLLCWHSTATSDRLRSINSSYLAHYSSDSGCGRLILFIIANGRCHRHHSVYGCRGRYWD